MKFNATLSVLTTIIIALSGCDSAPEVKNGVKLYAMDCGTFEQFDITSFSSKDAFKGQHATLSNPCFLIRHARGDLLWDTGLVQSLADMPDGFKTEQFHIKVKSKLTDQLAALDLTPADIDYVSISHSHPDHSGNGNMFAGSTFIANEAEYRFMFSDEKKADTENSSVYMALEGAKTQFFSDDYDVFGDASVVIKSMPGHTPGHSVLLVQLEKAGAVLLTGDLYIIHKSRELRAVPTFNVDAADTMRSFEKFEALAKKEKARVIIQHEMKDFKALPTFPAYLE